MAMNDGSISTELGQFFGAYFHQDWDLEADDWKGLVDNYVIGNPGSESQRQIAQEIDDVRTALSETALAQFLIRGVGVCYDPRPETTFKRVARADRVTPARARPGD
ncbi:contact-dependent growth inhibition system immunity protein [Mycolicibacterium vaccae]|uniref:CdiI immunity protein domain-containing protein n=2 Tax=Mycolicibacterium vaccae TaxID=1810 RepID=K0V3P5_MYCVA|nr:contact-dependent growth inhibition system immunity protein [Mycolicibacterium vaccae]EJZ12030.1 hypothetical protein MVAC_03801 [Mycolicibacterium vaccae ATCC 25954]